MSIKTAADLALADARALPKQFNVVLEKAACELRGIVCLELGGEAPPKQEICCSRMFGKRLRDPGGGGHLCRPGLRETASPGLGV